MNVSPLALSLRSLLVGAALAPSLLAQTWTEQGDAGDLPGTAQTVAGFGALTQIDGNIDDPSDPLGAGNDRDMYAIYVADPATFEATTTNGSTLDTQLFLFDSNGLGVTFNDDDPLNLGGLRSRITGQFVPAPGVYYLAISRYDRDPTAAGDQIWLDGPFNTERQPDGPGAAGVVDGWDGLATSSLTGSYSIFLTGAELVRGSCSDLTVTGDGTPRSTLTFDLAFAPANLPAIVMISPNVGTTTLRIGVLGTLELGLAQPIVPVSMGATDATGAASLAITLPPGNLPLSALHAQAMTVEFTRPNRGHPTLDFCTSDVEGFSIGQ